MFKPGDEVVALKTMTSTWGNVIIKGTECIVTETHDAQSFFRKSGYIPPSGSKQFIKVNLNSALWIDIDFRNIDRHTFTNSLTEKLANKPIIEEGVENPKPELV